MGAFPGRAESGKPGSPAAAAEPAPRGLEPTRILSATDGGTPLTRYGEARVPKCDIRPSSERRHGSRALEPAFGDKFGDSLNERCRVLLNRTTTPARCSDPARCRRSDRQIWRWHTDDVFAT